MLRNLVNLLLLTFLLGCETTAPTVEGPKSPPPEAPIVTPAQLEIERLLGEAWLAMQGDRLTTPIEDNAYFRYLQVLSIDEDNPDALQGLADIVERYLAWAIADARAGDFRNAHRYLTTARAIDQEHPNIPSVARMIGDMENANRLEWSLPIEKLEARASSIVQLLRDIGVAAEEHNATVVIHARSDAEGRWIYQQMNEASEKRVRARVELTNTPAVRLVY